jgi:hypothetical protein
VGEKKSCPQTSSDNIFDGIGDGMNSVVRRSNDVLFEFLRRVGEGRRRGSAGGDSQGESPVATRRNLACTGGCRVGCSVRPRG